MWWGVADETIDSFRSQWNNYKSKSRKFDENEKCIQEYLYSYSEYEEHNGFLEDASITLMGLIPWKKNFLNVYA